MQYYYTLPPRIAEQMLWGQFINCVGKPGHRDLHMEQLNRACKDAINHLGANKTNSMAQLYLEVISDIPK